MRSRRSRAVFASPSLRMQCPSLVGTPSAKVARKLAVLGAAQRAVGPLREAAVGLLALHVDESFRGIRL